MEQARNLPLTVVTLATVSCLLWLLSLVKLYRTWLVRRTLVRVLARFGAPNSVIANTARLSQDGVAFLTAKPGGNSCPSQREVFAGSGNEFVPFQALQPASKHLVTSTMAES
jgi:hypothetical protein